MPIQPEQFGGTPAKASEMSHDYLMTIGAAAGVVVAAILFGIWVAWLVRGRAWSSRMVDFWIARASTELMRADGRTPWFAGQFGDPRAQYGDPEYRRRMNLGAWLPLATMLPLFIALAAMTAAAE